MMAILAKAARSPTPVPARGATTGVTLLTIDNSTDDTFTGSIRDSYSSQNLDAGSIRLVKTGSGTLTLGRPPDTDSTFSGGTELDAGTIVLGSAVAFGVNSPSLVVNGGELDLNGNSIEIGALDGIGGTITDKSSGSGKTTITVSMYGASTRRSSPAALATEPVKTRNCRAFPSGRRTAHAYRRQYLHRRDHRG